MPSHLGVATKNIFLKSEEAIFSQEFTQDGLSFTITLSTALITGNVIAGNIGSAAVTATYATSGLATMQALAASIAAQSGVSSAVATSATVITIVPKNQTDGVPVTGFTVTSGASQPTTVIATVNNKIRPGMDVMLLANGNIAQADATAMFQKCIGYAMDKATNLPDGPNAPIIPAEITVALRGYAILTAEAAGALTPGPVARSAYNWTSDNNVFTGSGVTDDTLAGWSLDTASNPGDLIRVILKK